MCLRTIQRRSWIIAEYGYSCHCDGKDRRNCIFGSDYVCTLGNDFALPSVLILNTLSVFTSLFFVSSTRNGTDVVLPFSGPINLAHLSLGSGDSGLGACSRYQGPFIQVNSVYIRRGYTLQTRWTPQPLQCVGSIFTALSLCFII